ncbi:MAG: DNA methyltransferase, partial [Methanosarcina sp.]|nr:DNA methyltransferase [Methanosarcina sp.]
MLFNENDSEKEKMKAFAASCKPLEELLDSVRDIEGFPIGKDEDILALSDAPWYTACPNPYIKDFIEAFGKPYDEDTDVYERTPFISDVSEGKNDPMYSAHTYHTKVPHKAIMQFIKHYTEEDDIVFDGFCGTGMTGVAAQLLNRKAILCDISPIATYISYNYNTSVDVKKFEQEAKIILKKVENECKWMYETFHTDGKTKGVINYTVWSDVFICPYCKNDYVYWDTSIDTNEGTSNKEYSCPNCNSKISKQNSNRAYVTFLDSSVNQQITQAKQVPVLINYFVGNKRYDKKPDIFDIELIKKIEESSIPYFHPTNKIPKGDKTSDPFRVGISHVHHYYTKRNLWMLSTLGYYVDISKMSKHMKCLQTSILNRNLSKGNRFVINKYNPKGRINGPLSGTLYIPSLIVEQNGIELIKYKLKDINSMYNYSDFKMKSLVSTQSTTDLSKIKDNSIDYIFTDPPFGNNIMYSELNYLWESWIQIFTKQEKEAIMNTTQTKNLADYKELMISCFTEMYRILKPNRWITVEFHNSKASIWNAIQDSITKAGFIIAQVSVLDKKHGSINQLTAAGAVKNDLVINAYKPKNDFEQNFLRRAGENLEKDFIEEHLKHLPIEPNIERTEQMLYSKVLAHYVQHGYEIKLNAKQFYEMLGDNFKLIDGYWFLDGQINEYEEWKKNLGLKAIEEISKRQLTLFVNDENSSLIWLYNFLKIPRTYSDILTAYNQVITSIDDEIPELRELLDNNFIFENGIYRRPLT